MSRRQQIQMSDEEIAEFLDGRHSLNVATINHDGTIHLVAMWYAMLDGDCVFWTYGRSQKILNLRRNPTITGLVETGDVYEELKGVELVGRGEVTEDRDEIMEIGFAVADRYFGPVTEEAKPFIEATGAKRFGVRIKIDRIVSWDHTKLGGVY